MECSNCGSYRHNTSSCPDFKDDEPSVASAGYMPKTEREQDLELALANLCACKKYKDVLGKTETYERNKDKAWAEAFRLLGI